MRQVENSNGRDSIVPGGSEAVGSERRPSQQIELFKDSSDEGRIRGLSRVVNYRCAEQPLSLLGTRETNIGPTSIAGQFYDRSSEVNQIKKGEQNIEGSASVIGRGVGLHSGRGLEKLSTNLNVEGHFSLGCPYWADQGMNMNKKVGQNEMYDPETTSPTDRGKEKEVVDGGAPS